MKRAIITFLILLTFLSCGEYQKAINGDDIATKFALGTSLFDEGKFTKANRLFEQIVPKYRGKPQAQKLMYMHAICFYETKDFYTSNYRMEKFVNTYPNSEKNEEIAFLAAKSYYFMSPIFSKDQTDTKVAIDKLQLFINTFPDSEYITEVNELIFELDYKLEFKSYSKALQYNTLNDHESAIKSFDNLGDSVASYMKNLNSNINYEEFRMARNSFRTNKSSINSIELIEFLSNYAENTEYSKILKKIIIKKITISCF